MRILKTSKTLFRSRPASWVSLSTMLSTTFVTSSSKILSISSGVFISVSIRSIYEITSQGNNVTNCRSSHPEVFLGKGVLRICSKYTGEHPCRSWISIKLLCNFIEISLWHWCSRVNLLHIFRTPFFKNTSHELLL